MVSQETLIISASLERGAKKVTRRISMEGRSSTLYMSRVSRKRSMCIPKHFVKRRLVLVHSLSFSFLGKVNFSFVETREWSRYRHWRQRCTGKIEVSTLASAKYSSVIASIVHVSYTTSNIGFLACQSYTCVGCFPSISDYSDSGIGSPVSSRAWPISAS